MNIAALMPMTRTPDHIALRAAAPLEPGAFAAEMAQQRGLGANGTGKDMREAAEKLVASAMVLPALSSLHQSPLRPQAGPFAPSTIEKRFGPLLQVEFADRITKASGFNLVDTMVNRLQPQTGEFQPSAFSTNPTPTADRQQPLS